MTNTSLFSQFTGANLDRLVECLKAIKVAGLRTSDHTQAGVNPNSGNVWVWDEDWAGCVYCSIVFDVMWSHHCPECGEEYDFDTYSELVDYIDENKGRCDKCYAV
jgi:hypothetical protein